MTADEQTGPTPRVWRVSDLNRRVRGLLDADLALADIWVEGEVSQPSFPPSGHCFFTLKDAHSQIRAVLFREELARAVLPPGPQPPGRPGEPFPDSVAQGLEQQDLPLRPLERNPCGHHSGVVDDDERTADLLGEVAERPVRNTPAGPVEDEQPRSVPPVARTLGDQLGRQVVVELG